jgi:hypothetical protein
MYSRQEGGDSPPPGGVEGRFQRGRHVVSPQEPTSQHRPPGKYFLTKFFQKYVLRKRIIFDFVL